MDNQSIIIIILSLLCIIGVIIVNTKKQSEHFQQQNTCNFVKETGESDYNCVARCIAGLSNDDGNGNGCTPQSCLTACDRGGDACSVTDSGGNVIYTTCEINAQTDIGSANTGAGANIEQCVANCAAETCSGCSTFIIRDPQTGRRVTEIIQTI